MARRTKEPEPRRAELRPEQMRSALPRLRKRIEELRAVDVNTIQVRWDPATEALEQKVNSTLSDIFGPNTVEYQEFGDVRLDRAPTYLMDEAPLYEIREGLSRGISMVISSLEAIISLFQEKLGDESLDSTDRARQAFSSLELHPEIARAVTNLFEDGHCANAVEDACKVLDLLVKMRSGRVDLGGTELMQAVFSPKSPALKFSDLKTESEKSEQQGLMFLYAGAMLAFRNPRAHGLIQDDAENALDYIAFLMPSCKDVRPGS
ncbi:MAG TPA: TIGR02391 family protein [Thermoanaerobaculia bacterium]|nr:TIGR02391 family protein [Thermoanaerobaculia bacterium]